MTWRISASMWLCLASLWLAVVVAYGYCVVRAWQFRRRTMGSKRDA